MTVKFNQVSYVYQKGTPFEHVALRDIETTFQQGKYYAVIGQTGSGKSTLIQHFNGLLKPSTGKLQIDDITITHKAITSILAMDPDIVILDEPTAGLDPKSRDQIMKMIKKLQVEQNKTIILVTHEMNDVAKYVDEIKIMKQGQLVEACSPRKLFSDTNYVNQLHLDVPDVVKLQRDIEDKYQYYFNKIALTEDEFIDMYKEWQEDER